MKSAIVTGASGFIGSYLCNELISNDIDVTALVRNKVQMRLFGSVKSICCDMDAYSELEGNSADVFYHLAWEGATGTGRNDEVLQMKNATRSIEAMKAAQRLGCKRFIGVGTIYEKLVPQITSDTEHRTADFYLLSKQYAHSMCAKLAVKLGIEFVWVTIFQPIGKYIKTEQVMSYAINGLLNGNPPSFGPALQPYDITAVENIAYGLRLLGEKELLRTEYYIGSGTPKTLKEYLEETRTILDVSTELRIGQRPDDGLRFSFDWYDIAPLVSDTGYSPVVSYKDAVFNTAEWIKNTPQ